MTRTTAVQGGLPVLGPQDGFRFHCAPGVDCFTRCCQDITIFLTPYDVLRMKNALGLPSGEFLARYTVTLLSDNGLPMVVLQMGDDPRKRCPFVGPEGCRIYADRPWACRVYPLQPESNKITEKAGKAYFSVLNVPYCRGFAADRETTVEKWLADQGVPVYLEMEALFKTITHNERLSQAKITNKRIQDMIYMSCYDLDRFRRFVLESSFLERFELAPGEVEALREDDVALYRLAIRWLEYGLLAQQALKVRPEVLEAGKERLGIE